MKNIKSVFACAAAAFIFTVSGIYPGTGIITEIKNDVVTFEDFNGFLWSFEGAEDYAINDRVAVIFDDAGTEEIFDDIILQVRYCGYEEAEHESY